MWSKFAPLPFGSAPSRKTNTGTVYREIGKFARGGVCVMAREVVISPSDIPPEGQRPPEWDYLVSFSRWQAFALCQTYHNLCSQHILAHSGRAE